MKVCMVSYSYYDYDNRVRRYSETLAANGIDVDVIAVRYRDEPAQNVMNGVRVFRIQHRPETEKSKFTYLAHTFLFMFRAMLLLGSMHRQERYDVIHVHNIPDFQVFTALIPKITGVKVILDIHDVLPELYVTKFKGSKDSLAFKLLLLEEKLSTAFADHVIIANHIWEERLRQRSVHAGKLTAILNCPDGKIFRNRGRNRTDDRFVVVFPGTLSYHQGVDIAVDAFALIKNQIPEIEFHIYGDGEQMEALQQQVARLGLQQMVFFKEAVPVHQLAAIIENSDLGIDPKRTDGFADEALAVKVLEFMSLGVPMVISDTTANRYYFNESIVKFAAPNSAQNLADAILLVVRDKKLRETLVGNANEFVKDYMWEKHQDRYLNLVRSLATSKSGKRDESLHPLPQSTTNSPKS